MSRLIARTAWFLLVASVAIPARGATSPSRAGSTEAAAEERVSLRLLREKGIITQEEYAGALEEVAADAARDEAPRVGVTAELGKGVAFTSPDGRFALGLRPRIQLYGAGVVSTNAQGGTKEVNVRRMRLVGSGHVLSPKLTYGFMMGFGVSDTDATNPAPILDATLTWAPLRDISIQAGQWTVWMSRQQGDKAFALQFVERSPVTQELSLDRDVGVGVFSNDLLGLGGRLNYAVGLYGGLGRNRTAGAYGLPDQRPLDASTWQESMNDMVDGHFPNWKDPRPCLLAAGRVRINPLGKFDDGDEADLSRSSKPRLSVGMGGAYLQGAARSKGHIGDAYKLEGFDYWYGSVDFLFKWAGFSLTAETFTRFSDRSKREGKVANQPLTEYSRSATGVWVQSGYMLTDHVEVTGRVSDLIPWKDTDPKLKRVHEVATGLGFYFFKQSVKLQADYSYLAGDDLERGNHLARVQMTVTP